METDTSLEERVIAAQLGNASAFSDLVESHYSMVHGLALSTTRDWNAAGDITQEVFLVAWANLRSLRYPKAFSVWLRRIARNCGTNWVRSERYRAKVSISLDERPPEAGDPAAAAARRECLGHVREALETLSPKLREAVTLYYLEGNTMVESARVLGISVEAMKKRLSLGRARLLAEYQRQQALTLEQLLPYSPKPQAQRILAGLAVGPAVPSFGRQAAASRLTLVWHHLFHGGSFAALRESGLVALPAKQAAAALIAAIAVCSGTGAWVSHTFPQPGASHAVSRPPAGVPCYEGVGTFTSAHWNDPAYGDYVRIERPFPGYPASEAGLRPGDRVVNVNGRTVHPGYQQDPNVSFRGQAGTKVRFTVMRARPDGAEEQLEFEVTRGAIPDHLLNEAREEYRASGGQAIPSQEE